MTCVVSREIQKGGVFLVIHSFILVLINKILIHHMVSLRERGEICAVIFREQKECAFLIELKYLFREHKVTSERQTNQICKSSGCAKVGAITIT